MTRIIGGFAGSLQLRVPPVGTRPTSDRVREAIFSALEARDAIDGARALDLYSGSGALGLEAVSRGAASVTLVDRVNGAVRTARDNAELVRRAAHGTGRGTGRDAPPEITVTGSPVQSFLGGAAPGTTWDLVFLDPPYDLGAAELVHNLEALAPRLAPDAVVVVERSARDPEPDWPEGLELERRKDYGDTVVYWLAPTAQPGSPSTADSSGSGSNLSTDPITAPGA